MPGARFFSIPLTLGALLVAPPLWSQPKPPPKQGVSAPYLIPHAPFRRPPYRGPEVAIVVLSLKKADKWHWRSELEHQRPRLRRCIREAQPNFRRGVLKAVLSPGPRALRVSLERGGARDPALRRCTRRVLSQLPMERGEIRLHLAFSRTARDLVSLLPAGYRVARRLPPIGRKRSEIRAGIHNQSKPLGTCYAREKDRPHPHVGRVLVRFVIDGHGRVVQAETKTPGLRPLFRACVLSKVRQMRFRAGREVAIVSYPFAFR